MCKNAREEAGLIRRKKARRHSHPSVQRCVGTEGLQCLSTFITCKKTKQMGKVEDGVR